MLVGGEIMLCISHLFFKASEIIRQLLAIVGKLRLFLPGVGLALAESPSPPLLADQKPSPHLLFLGVLLGRKTVRLPRNIRVEPAGSLLLLHAAK